MGFSMGFCQGGKLHGSLPTIARFSSLAPQDLQVSMGVDPFGVETNLCGFASLKRTASQGVRLKQK